MTGPMYPLTIAWSIENRTLWEEVQNCLKDLPLRVVLQEQEVAGLLERIEGIRPDVVLVDISRVEQPVGSVFHRIRPCAPGAMIIALHTSADPETILASVRGGANEFLYPPLADGLRRALERQSEQCSRQRDGVRSKGKTIGFLSAKGGCGATTVACHTAVELGRPGKQQVLLADLDLSAGLVRFLLKSKSPYSVLDATNNLHRLDASYWKALVSNGYPGVEVIAAPDGFCLAGEPRPEQIRQVLRFARSHYGWTVVDLGRSLGPLVMAAFEEMDEACVVTTLDVPALHQSKQLIRALMDSGYGSHRLRLIINRTPKRLEITSPELEKMLGLPVYVMLPDDAAGLTEAYGEGKLLATTSQLGRHIARLSVKIAGVPEEKERRKFSLFG